MESPSAKESSPSWGMESPSSHNLFVSPVFPSAFKKLESSNSFSVSSVASASVELTGIGTANNKPCNAAEASNIGGETCRNGTSKLFRRNDLIMYLALGI